MESAEHKYYKTTAESDLGEGTAYFEFDGEWAIRQVENYGDRWFYSSKSYHQEIGPALCDQPLSELGLGPEHEISKESFEQAWDRAKRGKCQ
jgi:hypothetical protein